MKAPCSYADWSACLEVLENGANDEEAIRAMTQGELAWSSGVANLFSERISEVFSTRLQRCANRMARDLNLGADEITLVRALLDTRRNLALLYRVAIIPAFPQMLREHLSGELKRYAERAHSSLEDSAKHDRSGKLTSLIRHNSLLGYDASAACASSLPMPASNYVVENMPTTARKRTILA